MTAKMTSKRSYYVTKHSHYGINEFHLTTKIYFEAFKFLQRCAK